MDLRTQLWKLQDMKSSAEIKLINLKDEPRLEVLIANAFRMKIVIEYTEKQMRALMVKEVEKQLKATNKKIEKILKKINIGGEK